MMLEGFVSSEAAKLYLYLLLHDDDAPATGDRLAGGGDRQALAELNRLGLVRTAEQVGGLAAVDPSEAFTRLLVGVDRQAVARHEELGRLLRVLDGLRLDDERAAQAGEPGPIVQVLTDLAAITRLVRQSRVAARTEYLAVVAAGPYAEPPLGWPDDVAAGAESAPARVLYAGACPPAELADRPVRDSAGPARRSSAVRHGPPASLDIRVIDQHTAILALAREPAGGAGSVVVVRSEPIVGLLRSCFLLLWERAGAGAADPAGGGPLTPFDRRVVGLLADGHRDAEIARLTGTSVRTVRRRIAVIAEEVGATSRFAIGVEAYRRGLVPRGPGHAAGPGAPAVAAEHGDQQT